MCSLNQATRTPEQDWSPRNWCERVNDRALPFTQPCNSKFCILSAPGTVPEQATGASFSASHLLATNTTLSPAPRTTPPLPLPSLRSHEALRRAVSGGHPHRVWHGARGAQSSSAREVRPSGAAPVCPGDPPGRTSVQRVLRQAPEAEAVPVQVRREPLCGQIHQLREQQEGCGRMPCASSSVLKPLCTPSESPMPVVHMLV
jgi:hypothetical protein